MATSYGRAGILYQILLLLMDSVLTETMRQRRHLRVDLNVFISLFIVTLLAVTQAQACSLDGSVDYLEWQLPGSGYAYSAPSVRFRTGSQRLAGHDIKTSSFTGEVVPIPMVMTVSDDRGLAPWAMFRKRVGWSRLSLAVV